MAYRTFTANQCDTRLLQSRYTILQQYFTEVITKKCLSTIQGLESHSFKFSNEDEANNFESLFCNLPVWIKRGLKSIDESQSSITNQYGNLVEVSFGYLASTISYSWSKNIQNDTFLEWRTDNREKYIAIKYKARSVIELRLTQECLDKYFIVSTSMAGCYIILPLKVSPRCYRILQRNNRQYYERIFDFGIIDQLCLANSTALCLQFRSQEASVGCIEFLVNAIKLECHRGFINCIEMEAQKTHFNHILSDFWSSYAFQMLFTLGYRIKNQITLNTLRKIKQLSSLSKYESYPNHRCYLKLMAVYYRARNNRFFDINEEFDNIQPFPPSIVLDKWEYVPRVYLTPYGVFPLSIKPMRGNRILRERQHFGPAENFCRVIFRDIDLGQAQKDFMQINEKWIKNLIIADDYIIVGNQRFHFLLCSNSQLRDRSFWFHASYCGHGVEYIRQWMGDFSNENCIGTRIARMALSLTGTTPTIELSPCQMERIDDILDDHGRIFTDGAGKISPEALKKALMAFNSDLIEDNYMPCVIQARLNGIKGIFVIAPDLNKGNILIQYRPSQYKFKTNHNVLEIVKPARSGMAFLNRQVIVLLENMGVGKYIFLKLQNKARIKISMSLLANKSAQHTLEQNVRLYDWDRMHKSGIQLTTEPFMRSLLLLLAGERLKRLKERSHIQISLSDGRMLLGVVDETNSLQYGQVFIQLRDLKGETQIIYNQKILITKNPAHFPGDIRILDAIDCPMLHHLYECVVFPAQGQRPHPNEISGSDLDGDEYWVCWNNDLVNNATKQYPPATFDSAGKKKHDGEITMKDIADFLFKYVSSDSLGVLSNRHLACCTLHGPNHKDSLRLAKIISQAVDFPKTGILPKNPIDIKLDQYPDFMENKYKEPFETNTSIGTMYRQVKEVWKIHSTWQDKLEEEHININKDFLIHGYEKYINEAEDDYEYYTSRMKTILSIYNLGNEYELITGCHFCIEEEKKNNDSVETASLEFRHLIHEMRKRFATNELSHIKQLRKASAWYYVAYKAGTLLSFGWIMDRLMSDIIKQKRIFQEEYQALKRIGEAIRNSNLEAYLKDLTFSCNTEDADCKNYSYTGRLGYQFLKTIDKWSECANEQYDFAHQILIFLHKIALNAL